jgi:hypothetical protein
MKRYAAVLALVLAVGVPFGVSAKTKGTPAPAGSLSAMVPSCPASDPVVWVNTSSKIYWAAGTEYYGKTKHGGYACTSVAKALGARAAKASPIRKSGSPLPAPTP